MSKQIKYGIILLAAGSSSRLGTPKQSLVYHGVSLLQHTIDISRKIPNSVIAVITGAWQHLIEKELAGKEVLVYHNPNWESGMASSIKTGLNGLHDLHPALEAVLITVCDQPYLSVDVLISLIQRMATSGKGIAAAAYSGTFGPPALFSNQYFHALQILEGQEGAKKIIRLHPNDTAFIDFPEGSIDIDTREDYQRLIS